MLRSYLLAAGLSAVSIGMAASAGCGGTDVAGNGGAGGGDAGPPAVHALPPDPPTAVTPPDGPTDVTFAIRKLYLGDTKRDGTADKVNGWKEYGFDLDGKISTATSTDLCKPRNNAPVKNVYPDGLNGIDNSFGKNILPIILGLSATAATSINDSITKGTFTIMLSMGKLGTGKEYNPIVTKLYGGSELLDANMMPLTPKFDGNDKWPVVPELLEAPGTDITKTLVHFDKSYLVDNTWVSGSKGTISLNLSIQGYQLSLTIASALISMDLSADHKGATKGTIAGVLATDTLTSELKKVAGGFDPTLCMGPTIDSIIAQIEQASDIMQDGTAGDPSKTCDGISIGLGFDAATVQLGAIAPMSTGGGDPCAIKDGGTD
jgi:hypothetical protein